MKAWQWGHNPVSTCAMSLSSIRQMWRLGQAYLRAGEGEAGHMRRKIMRPYLDQWYHLRLTPPPLPFGGETLSGSGPEPASTQLFRRYLPSPRCKVCLLDFLQQLRIHRHALTSWRKLQPPLDPLVQGDLLLDKRLEALGGEDPCKVPQGCNASEARKHL